MSQVNQPPACSVSAAPPPVGARKVLGRPGDFVERWAGTPDLYLLLGRQGIQWGWARRAAWLVSGELPLAGAGDDAMRGALAALPAAIPGTGKTSARLIVRVADVWLAQAGLPWPSPGGALETLARAQLTRAGFEAADDALLRVDEPPLDGPRLVVAYPGWLLQALAVLAAGLGLQLHSVLPLSCAVAALLPARGPGRLAVAYLAEAGALTEIVCARAGGQIAEVNVVPGYAADFPDAAAMQAAWQRLQLRQPHVLTRGGAGWLDLRVKACRAVKGMFPLQAGAQTEMVCGAGLPLLLASRGLCSSLDAVTPHAKPVRWLQVLLLLLGLALGLAGLQAWQQGREVLGLQQALGEMAGEAQPVAPVQVWSREELQQVRAVNAAVRTLNLPVDALLQALEPPRDIRVVVHGVETIGMEGVQAAGRLRISAQAPSSGEMARYVAFVAERKPFVAAYLLRHEQITEAGAPVLRFSLEATWVD